MAMDCLHFDDLDTISNIRFGSFTSEESKVNVQKVETILPLPESSIGNVKTSLHNYDDIHSVSSHSYSEQIVAKLQAKLHLQQKQNRDSELKIASLENELSALKMEYEMKFAVLRQKDSERIAGMVEEIVEAQKEREASILARMKLALQERDEAILRAKALSKKNPDIYDKNNNGDGNLTKLVSAICEADSGKVAENYSHQIIGRIDNLKKKKDEITSEEMKMLICERDTAVQRFRSLKASIPATNHDRGCTNKTSHHKLDLVNAGVQVSVDPLKNSLGDLSQDGQDVEMLRICYSLHKSLVESGRLSVEQAEQRDAERLVESLRVEQDHNRIQDVNNRWQEEQLQRLTNKNERLERLVTVLRKKLALLAQKSASIHQESVDNTKYR